METIPSRRVQANKIIGEYLLETTDLSHPANAMRVLGLFELALGIDEEELIEKLIKFDAIRADQIDDYESTSSWQGKAEWLRVNGYGLNIGAVGFNRRGDMASAKWVASIDGGNRYLAVTIGEAVEHIYELVTLTNQSHLQKTKLPEEEQLPPVECGFLYPVPDMPNDYHVTPTHNCQQVHDHTIGDVLPDGHSHRTGEVVSDGHSHG